MILATFSSNVDDYVLHDNNDNNLEKRHDERRSRSYGVLLRGVGKVKVPQAKCHDLDRFEEIERSESKNNRTKYPTHHPY